MILTTGIDMPGTATAKSMPRATAAEAIASASAAGNCMPTGAYAVACSARAE